MSFVKESTAWTDGPAMVASSSCVKPARSRRTEELLVADEDRLSHVGVLLHLVEQEERNLTR
jgi:hypothetical protein